jgi:aryl-alcohol dehydrogenase-like predicted oxidoreductase
MTFGTEWGWGADKETSRRIFDHYASLGGNFVDTSNFYTNGTSEAFLGEFLRERREQFVLATKYSLHMRPGDPNSGGNHRKNLVQSLEASLRRLRTDYIDLYWLHIWEGRTPIDEVMRALDDVVRQGKVLTSGCPTCLPGRLLKPTPWQCSAGGRPSSHCKSSIALRSGQPSVISSRWLWTWD